MTQLDNIHSEKLVLRISFIMSTFFLLCEVVAAIWTNSQAVLIDCLYALVDLLMLIPLMLLVSKLHKPVSERWPYGLSQLEPMFIIIRCTILLVMDFFLIKDSIEMIIAGGNTVNAHAVAGFEFAMAMSCIIMYIILRFKCRRYMSPAMESELYVWKVDAYSTAGVGLAFVIQIIIQKTPLAWLTPYIDPGIAVIMAVILLWEPITMIYEAVKSLILAAPGKDITDTVRQEIENQLAMYNYKLDFLDIIKTGRRIWVDVYVIFPAETVDLTTLKSIQENSMNTLNGELEDDIFVEIIPELKHIKKDCE